MARGWAEAGLENGRRGSRLFEHVDRRWPDLHAWRRAFDRRRSRGVSDLFQPGRWEATVEDEDGPGMARGPAQLAKLPQHADGGRRSPVCHHPGWRADLLQDERRRAVAA